MNKIPRVSVITAVFNGEDHINECIESVRSQTLPDYEHIIINDASTDGTEAILEEWRQKDERIRVLKNNVNKGRAISRNRGITVARAPLLAILDADDYSMPERLETQCNFLDAHPDVAVAGSDMLIHGNRERLSHPESNADIRAQLFFDSSLFHSTVMMRKDFLKIHKIFYNDALPLAQDYGLWATLMAKPDVVFANLHIPLSCYRMPESPRPGYRERQIKFANTVRADILRLLEIKPDKETMAAHLALLFASATAFGVEPEQCRRHGEKLLAANTKKKLTTTKALENQVASRLNRVIHNYQQ